MAPTKLLVQRNPRFYASPTRRGGEGVEVIDASGTIEQVDPSVATFYLARDPVLNLEEGVFRRLDPRHFFAVKPEQERALTTADGIADQVLARAKGVRARSIFSDLTLVHHTRRLEELDPERRMKDNPLFVLNRAHGRIFCLLDGKRTAGDVYSQITREYGAAVSQPEFLGFLGDLEALRVLEGAGVLASRYGDPRRTVRDWDLNAARIQRQLVYTELPMYTLLELTSTCNLNCADCYTHGFDRYQLGLTDGEFDPVLQLILDAGVSHVTILGGEPLTQPKLLMGVIRRLRSADVYTKLITNGTLVTQDLARQLDESGLNRVEISLDGFVPETNDRSRGAGTFAKIEEAIGFFRQTRIPEIGLSVTVTSDTLDEVSRYLPAYVRKHGVQKVYFSQFYSRGQANERELPAEERARLIAKCAEWTEAISRDDSRFEAVVLGNECTCGRSSVVVSPYGGIRGCPFMSADSDRIGTGMSLSQVWAESPTFWKIRSTAKDSCAARMLRDGVAGPLRI